MSEHHFTAEGVPCQRCGVLLDNLAAGEPCRHDPGDLTPVEIGSALALLAAVVAVSAGMIWSDMRADAISPQSFSTEITQ